MGRIRTVKPELLIHEGLQELESCMKMPVILVFIGLITQADREGRFRWKPRILKLAVLPFMSFDMETAMNGLHYAGFILKYQIDEEVYGYIPTFSDHQFVNAHEKKSDLPAYEDAYACTCIVPKGIDKKLHARGEGKGKEGNGKRKGKAPSEPEQAELLSPEFLRIPLNQGEYVIRESEICEWETLYPALDVRQEVREVLAWNLANPTKRKTATGVREHIRRWLSKAQDMGGSRRDYGNQRSGRSGAEAARVLDDLERIAAGGIA